MNKKCISCNNEMIIDTHIPDLPNKEIKIYKAYKCLSCGCKAYQTNILEIAEKAIKDKTDEFLHNRS